jgi:hypothetical protein
MINDLIWLTDYTEVNKGYMLIKTQVIMTGILGRTYHHKYFTLYKNGMLKIHKGYWWNGDSGVEDVVLKASMAHDCCYQLIELGALKEYWDRRRVDKLYYKLNVEGGMSKIRAGALRYLGVRLFGWAFC